jgi:hypothetical protein
MGDWPSQLVMHFRGRPLPESGLPAGYASLIERYDLSLPLPPRLSAIANRHHPGSNDAWLMQTPRHQPHADFASQLTYAFKYEGIDLAVLRQLFSAIDGGEIEAFVRETPTGTFATPRITPLRFGG